MVRGLRILLIAAASLSTILVGLRDVFAEACSTTIAISAISGDALDGMREDDSGTPPEQVEEDDGEEYEGREIHLFATTALACRLVTLVRVTCPPTWSMVAARHGRAVHARGPPPTA